MSSVTRMIIDSHTAVSGWWSWKFWMPTIFVLLAVVIPDFNVINVQAASGAAVETDLIATMANENSLRELLFFLSLLGLGLSSLILVWCDGGKRSTDHPSVSLWLILGMLAYVIASLAWSTAPSITFRRTVITTFFVSGAWGIGRVWQSRDLVRMVLLLSGVFALSGLAAEIAYGTFLAGEGYRFSGLLHPNQQALSCGLFMLAALTMKAGTGNRWYWVLAAVAFFFVLLTGSRGGAVATASAAVFHSVACTRSSRRLGWLLAAGMLLGFGLLFLAVEPNGASRLESLAKLGRSDPLSDPKNLTGRLPIWEAISADIEQRPMLGYGWAAYWTPDRVHRLSYIHDWEFSNAHSSYLEVMLGLGAVGLALGLLSFTAVFGRGLRIYSLNHDPGWVFLLSVFVMALVSGLIESTFVSVGYEFVVTLAGAFMIAYFPLPAASKVAP